GPECILQHSGQLQGFDRIDPQLDKPRAWIGNGIQFLYPGHRLKNLLEDHPMASGIRSVSQPLDQPRRGRRRLCPGPVFGRRLPLPDDGEISCLETSTAGISHDLAARRLRRAIRLHDDDRLGAQLEMLEAGPDDVREYVLEIDRAPAGALHLDDHGKLFASVLVHRKCGATAGSKRLVALLHHMLDILRVDVSAADDHQVFQAPGHEQLPIPQEPEIAASEPGPFFRGISVEIDDARLKGLEGQLRLVPVTERHTWSGDPDLTHFAWRAPRARLRIDDLYSHLAADSSGTDECRRQRIVFLANLDLVTLERVRAASQTDRRLIGRTSGHAQRGLGEAIPRLVCRRVESIRPVRFGEASQRLRPYRLRAVPGHLPATEIEPLPLFWRGVVHAGVEHEVGTGRRVTAVTIDGPEEPNRTLHERRGRQDITAAARIDRSHHSGNQAEVMEER